MQISPLIVLLVLVEVEAEIPLVAQLAPVVMDPKVDYDIGIKSATFFDE